MFKAILKNSITGTSGAFYDDTSSDDLYKLSSASLNLELGAAGSFNFIVPPTNVSYDSFSKLTSYIDVYRNDDLVFSGRVIDESKDYSGLSTVTCEGLLALFNDTYFAPKTVTESLSDLLTDIIETSHNSQVADDKKIYIGNITVEDETLYRSYENYELTIDRLNDLKDSYGGYMSVRKDMTDGKLYFDWYAEYTEVSSQGIDFGVNLIDLTQESAAEEIVTVLVPLGSEIEDEAGNKAKLTVASVNDGKVYVEDADGIAEYGRVVGIQTWEDVTQPAILLSKATAHLKDMTRSRVTINVTAVDMAKAGSSVEYFKVGQKVHVSASAFGVDTDLLVNKQTLDLMNPASNRMSLGDEMVGYVGKTKQNQKVITKSIDDINQKSNKDNTAIKGLTDDAKKLNESFDALQKTLTDTYITQEASEEAIKTAVEQIQTAYDTKISDIQSELTQTAESITAQFTDTVNDVKRTFKFNENGLDISVNNSNIYSHQGNDEYSFKNRETGETVMRIDTDGMTSLQNKTTGQLEVGAGTVDAFTEQWAIRKGQAVGTNKYNLDFVWIGG